MIFSLNRQDVRMAWNLFRMTLRDRFLGSSLGMLWAWTSPALMLGIFIFAFGFVFKAKLPGAETSLTYVIWLISGYGPWLAISEGLAASTTSVVANAGMIKNLPMKTELLPMAGALTGIVPLVVAIILNVALMGASGTTPSWSWILIPFAVLVQFMLVAGIGLFLAALNVFVRDVALVLPNALLILLFASPIFYQLEQFPPVMRTISQFNPFYALTEAYRQPLLYGQVPPLWQLIYVLCLTVMLFMLGLVFFRRLKSHFDSRL